MIQSHNSHFILLSFLKLQSDSSYFTHENLEVTFLMQMIKDPGGGGSQDSGNKKVISNSNFTSRIVLFVGCSEKQERTWLPDMTWLFEKI